MLNFVGFVGFAERFGFARRDLDDWSHQAGQKDKARDLFGAFLLMSNAGREFPNLTPYLMKRRGVFKNASTRGPGGKLVEVRPGPDQVREIDYTFEAVKPFLRA